MILDIKDADFSNPEIAQKVCELLVNANINSFDISDISSVDFRALYNLGFQIDGAIVYAEMPIAWGAMEVADGFPEDMTPTEEVDEYGEIILRKKTYREYLQSYDSLDGERILARLACKMTIDNGSCISVKLEYPELAGTISLIGIENIYTKKDAVSILKADYFEQSEVI